MPLCWSFLQNQSFREHQAEFEENIEFMLAH